MGIAEMGRDLKWTAVCAAFLDIDRLQSTNPTETSFTRQQRHVSQPAIAADWTPLGSVSPYLTAAVIKAEDPAFTRHHGISWPHFRAAALAAFRGRTSHGASTITQQLAKNLYLSPERRVSRKVAEAILARRMDSVLGKARVLELYLNVVEWGSDVWGISRASREYCGRTPSELDLFQAVVLASMLPAPKRPLAHGNAERAFAQQQRTIRQLYGSGMISLPESLAATGLIENLITSIRCGFNGHDLLKSLSLDYGAGLPTHRATLTTAGLLATHCGYSNGLAFWRFLRTVQRESLRIDWLPTWWSAQSADAALRRARAA